MLQQLIFEANDLKNTDIYTLPIQVNHHHNTSSMSYKYLNKAISMLVDDYKPQPIITEELSTVSQLSKRYIDQNFQQNNLASTKKSLSAVTNETNWIDIIDPELKDMLSTTLKQLKANELPPEDQLNNPEDTIDFNSSEKFPSFWDDNDIDLTIAGVSTIYEGTDHNNSSTDATTDISKAIIRRKEKEN